MLLDRKPRPGWPILTRICRRLGAGAALLVGLFALQIPAQSAFADGSVDVNTGADSSLRNRPSAGPGGTMPGHNGYTVMRAYARAGETIQMGSSAMGLGGEADILVYAPGTSFAGALEPATRAPLPTDPVFSTDVFSCIADDPGTGRIAGRVEELAGPAPNLGGYTPCQYTAPADGVYAVVMVPYSVPAGPTGLASTVGSPATSTSQGTTISIWDVTVRDATASRTVQPGRVFTNVFEFMVPTAVATVSNLSAFIYTPAGHLYRVTVFNPRNKAWDLAANGSGVVDATTGDPISASFQWGLGGPTYPPTLAPTHGEALAPQMWEGDAAVDSRYPIFFRTPDPVVLSGPGGLGETRGYPSAPMAPEGGLSPALSFTGAGGVAGVTAPGAGGTIAIKAPQLQGADYDLALDLDRNGSFGGGADVEYSGRLTNLGAADSWDGRDSTGTLVPCGVSYQFQATSQPEMHIVQSDTATEAGIQIDRLTLSADPLLSAPLAASYDDVDPYKGTAITTATPSAVSEGTSGPTFHGWGAGVGRADFIDTWATSTVNGTGTFEVRCPTAGASPAGKAPATNPPSNPDNPDKPKNHKPKKHKHHTKDKAPRLSLTLTTATNRAHPGSVIAYLITVTNSGGSAARNVKVCDQPPAGQRVLRTTPSAEGGSVPCWTIETLAAGSQRVFRLTSMVEPFSGPVVQRNAATAAAANVKGVRTDLVAVRIRPLPQTACGSRLARPVGPSSIRLRC